jgi:hypothetical protein
MDKESALSNGARRYNLGIFYDVARCWRNTLAHFIKLDHPKVRSIMQSISKDFVTWDSTEKLFIRCVAARTQPSLLAVAGRPAVTASTA